MRTGEWKLGNGRREIHLFYADEEVRVVGVASGEPPTGGDIDLVLGPHMGRFAEHDDGTLICNHQDGRVLWRRDAPPAAQDAPVGVEETVIEEEATAAFADVPDAIQAEEGTATCEA